MKEIILEESFLQNEIDLNEVEDDKIITAKKDNEIYSIVLFCRDGWFLSLGTSTILSPDFQYFDSRENCISYYAEHYNCSFYTTLNDTIPEARIKITKIDNKMILLKDVPNDKLIFISLEYNMVGVILWNGWYWLFLDAPELSKNYEMDRCVLSNNKREDLLRALKRRGNYRFYISD